MKALLTVKPGMQTLIQDTGRYRVAQMGLSCGGPMDLHAYCWANRLLGNDISSPTLEITLGNAAFKALKDCWLSLTGAPMPADIDGKPLHNWRSFLLKKGQTLSLSVARSGMRAYLAIEGGFVGADVFNSAATVVRNQLGGHPSHPGEALNKGDILQQRPASSSIDKAQWVERHFTRHYDSTLNIAVIESYQAKDFSDHTKRVLYQKPYTLTQQCNRMGAFLEGEPIQGHGDGVISEGIALGAIQLPANGQPIILLNDRQTLGGYPKIGCVSKLSLMKLGQARPGDRIQFYRADLALETDKYRQFVRFFGL
ncbi:MULTISPECIES: biotin-dependent carboxyltransferase family protein [unclassified Vibrio]|uniref:Biotin-dependent carboxyltransferase family protein n=1 Tax=Vibrio sp. HB236076 TaxID=3232307 RepID=A0AB39HKB5_9VIBR|nr:biotin-dependent carboxyltransferase family protein [Vibrio sp. HB161653]MDP5253040.1 biotin-dependent carboxyltransferase family protein [Vibrio sp. HB161653]